MNFTPTELGFFAAIITLIGFLLLQHRDRKNRELTESKGIPGFLITAFVKDEGLKPSGSSATGCFVVVTLHMKSEVSAEKVNGKGLIHTAEPQFIQDIYIPISFNSLIAGEHQLGSFELQGTTVIQRIRERKNVPIQLDIDFSYKFRLTKTGKVIEEQYNRKYAYNPISQQMDEIIS